MTLNPFQEGQIIKMGKALAIVTDVDPYNGVVTYRLFSRWERFWNWIYS